MSDLIQIKNDENLKCFFEKNPNFDLSKFNFSDENAVDLLNWDRFDKDTICASLKMYQELFKEDIVHSFFEKNPNFNLSTFNLSDENAVKALNWEGLDKDKICDRLKVYQGLLNNDKSLKLFFDNNPNFYLANFNFSDEKAVEALKWQGLDKDKICDRLKAYQRLLRLGIAPSEAEKLLEKPLMTASQGGEQSKLSEPVSALAIASTSEAEYVQTSNIDPETARETHRNATQATAGRMVLLANAMQFGSPRLGTMLADNAAQVRENFQSLPSYQKLFGSLDYLQCDPCQSIFSPAAYFVDLMRIIEQYIAQVNKGNQGFIGLSDRRPDLENIPLTCDNTNDSVPYTQIVSEVLAEKLTKELGKDAFRHLATAKYSGRLPFNLYLEQIRIYLGHFNTNLADIYATFQPQEHRSSIWGREYLGFSPEEYNLITTANTSDLSERYGVSSDTDLGGLKKKETFLKQTGLSWQELKDLLYQNLSPEEIKSGTARQFYINKKLNGQYLNLNEQGEIENLSLDTLDRVDRFLRLARKLNWSFADLDWVLTSIQVEYINEEAITKIAKIKQLQAITKLPLDVLCSFWYEMKAIGKGDNPNRPQDLFDRVFNNSLILQGQEKYKPNSDSASVFKIGNLNTDEDKENSRLTRSRLLAALQLSDRELSDIIEGIWNRPTDIELNVANLSRLFRISQILKLLGLKVDDYKLLLKFLNESFTSLEKLELDKLTKIIEFAQWLKVSGFSLYELDYILNGTVHPSVEVFLPEEKLVAFMESLWKKVQLPNKQERKNLSEKEIKRLEEEKRKNLEDELNEKVAIHFGIEPGLFSVLAQLAVQTGKAQDCIQLLLTPVKTEESNWQKNVECLKFISRMRLLVSKLDLTETELRSISHHPQSYNIESLTKLTVKDIENLYKCKNQLVRIFSNSEGDLAKYFEAPSVENLAKLTGWKVEEIQKANDFLKTKPNDTKPEQNDTKPEQNDLYNSVEGLLKLKQCFELCATLGCNIDFLGDLSELLKNGSVANNWDKYQNVARSVISLAKAKYDSEEWAKVFGKLNGILEERKSNILTDFALQKLGMENPRPLSEYLLLDVEMTSCACNSRIQLAILSVQTYLQRCRIGLEPGVTQVNIPAVWWEWIMNYRIWEANRKVFLYPENYIDPSLRKNASPIFKELQDELLQSEITAETVEAAYRNYFDKFAEIAKLQIVDGCRYWVQTPKSDKAVDTLFIFAKTITEPHTFYYRRCEQPEANKPSWGYWEKIDLQINSEYLAPVYAFNRLFVFWVETKEIQKSQRKPPTTQATVKYSFLNASQKWISPQTLIADVEIPNNFFRTSDKNFWQQVYPLVVTDENSQPRPELIILWGGLSAISPSVFNKKVSDFLEQCNIVTKIASDLFPDSVLNSTTFLSEARENLAAATVENLVVFAGGNTGGSGSKKVDVFAYKDGKLEKQHSSLELSEGRDNLAAATVENLVVFAGGNTGGSRSKKVDVFAYKDGKLEKQQSSLELSEGRDNLAAATVKSLVVFAGGYTGDSHSNDSHSNQVDVFAYKNGKLEKQPTPLTLSESRDRLAATTVGNLVVFAGGNTGSSHSNQVDIFYFYKPIIGTLPSNFPQLPTNTTLTPIKHQGSDFILQCRSEAFFQNNEQNNETKFSITRLTTNTIQQFSHTLFATGLDGLLSLDSQEISEPSFPHVSNNKLDFDGAYGAYFWEIFFHIPFLIASTLNAHQRYNEARQWYQYIFNPTQPQIKIPKPISYWLLNEGNATTISDKEGTNKGTLTGTPNWTTVTDFPGSASRYVLQFDGDSTYVTLTAASNLKLNNSDFTVEAWVKADDLRSDDRTILGMDDDRTDNKCLHLVIRNKKAYMGFHGNDLAGNAELKEGIWYQIVWRYTKSRKEQAIFINGKLDASITGHTSFEGTHDVNIGRWEKYHYFKGKIANVRIWNVALSNEQIFNNFENVNVSDRFWRFLPFRGQTPEKLKEILTNEGAIQAYKENPFDPHAIARLRIGAYEKVVVMKYIDNLLNWGDALFTQDNWESITQATTLYLLAYDLLGPKPKNVGKPPSPEPKTFAQIKAGAKGNISDFLIDLETHPEYEKFIKQFGDAVPFNALDAYFCVSENQEFAQYWDRVEDRLFKIRHCQNIKGIERQLALFQPPIEPMQLVRQAAAGDGGLSLSLTDSVPHYRFSHLLERAKGMASTVIQLGSTLLNTLEKKDAEELALLRATQEPVLLQLITKTKEKQIQEAEANLISLQKSLEAASDRSKYYQKWLAGGWNAGEKATVALMSDALLPQTQATAIRGAAVAAYLLPNTFGLANGGMQFGEAVNVGASTLDGVAGILSHSASLASTVAQYQRRQEDWELQKNMADWDTQQIKTQIEAAKVRMDLAKAELDVHHKSLEQSRQVEQFYKDKFTNKDLYQWMVGRLSGLYFQTYKIALEMAYSAQKAYQYELNKDDTYLQPTYWDSYKKGLLAGESLMLGLNQLEKAYLDGSDRRLEIEKIISLRQLLGDNIFDNNKNEGSWIFSFTQELFDQDFPGHYCRQIKTISVTLPAVVGPYQTIKATLTQTNNKVLIKPNQDAVNWLKKPNGNPPDSSILRQNWHNNQKIAISKGVNDSGLFVLNFQDERYLPFEGTGAISDWKLSMPKATNQIDFNSITDVIITLSYTALHG